MDSTHSKIHFGVSHEVDTLKGMAEILKRGVSRNKKKSLKGQIYLLSFLTQFTSIVAAIICHLYCFLKNVKGELGNFKRM